MRLEVKICLVELTPDYKEQSTIVYHTLLLNVNQYFCINIQNKFLLPGIENIRRPILRRSAVNFTNHCKGR